MTPLTAVLFILVGSVLSHVQKNCPTNEVWLHCATCEGRCYESEPLCTKDCKAPGCYCPLDKGFVRFGFTGACIPASQCPAQPTSKPPRCPKNEIWQDCGCDQHCQEVPPCPPVCLHACYCKNGFVRGWDGRCIKKSQCSAHPDCAFTSCPVGSACVWQPKQCVIAPCSQVECKPAGDQKRSSGNA